MHHDLNPLVDFITSKTHILDHFTSFVEYMLKTYSINFASALPPFSRGESQVHQLITLRPAPGTSPALRHLLAQPPRDRRPRAKVPLSGAGDAQQIAAEAT